MLRMTPLTTADLKVADMAFDMIPNYLNTAQIVMLIVALALVLVFYLLLFIFAPRRKTWPKMKQTAISFVLVCAVTAGTWAFCERTQIIPHNFENLWDAYHDYGVPYCFLNTWLNKGVSKPDGYSAAQVSQWAQGGAEYARPDVQPNVLFVMCEAFSDLSEDPAFAYSAENDPLAGYKAVISSENAVSGHIVVNNFGAGTANTEFDVLTGIQTGMLGSTSSFRVIHKSLNALPRAYARTGYQTYFMHPGQSWFYNRDSVYEFLGMEDRVFLDAFDGAQWKGSMISDASCLDQLKADFSSKLEADEPLFAYTVTIQNHQAYNYSKYDFLPDRVPLSIDISDEAMEALSVYMQGVRDSSQMLFELTQYLETLDEPVLLVFFGDHLPTLLGDYGVYRELGMPVGNTDSPEAILRTYETPYILWANTAYAAQCDFAALDAPARISANYLGALVYELTGMGGTDPYFDDLMQLLRELPVISHNAYVLPDGTVTNVLSDEQSAIVERLDHWKYYRLKDEALITTEYR
jgi:hypothetical protein